VTFSLSGFEEFFLEIGMAGDEPPEEFARRLAPYGGEITGPPLVLADG
jgi:hypothetical protein